MLEVIRQETDYDEFTCKRIILWNIVGDDNFVVDGIRYIRGETCPINGCSGGFFSLKRFIHSAWDSPMVYHDKCEIDWEMYDKYGQVLHVRKDGGVCGFSDVV